MQVLLDHTRMSFVRFNLDAIAPGPSVCSHISGRTVVSSAALFSSSGRLQTRFDQRPGCNVLFVQAAAGKRSRILHRPRCWMTRTAGTFLPTSAATVW